MKKLCSSLIGATIAFFSLNTYAQQENMDTKNMDPENTIIMELSGGPVEILLFPDKAPQHVQRIKELTRENFYNGLAFHRVIEGFMAQTGDPTGTGAGSSSKPNLTAEFNDIKHDRGTVSMARASDPNSANSQFFIMLAAAPHLDGQYTAFGKVLSGMEYVDQIKKGAANKNGAVDSPDHIISMKVLADTQTKATTESTPAIEAQATPAIEAPKTPDPETTIAPDTSVTTSTDTNPIPTTNK